MPRHELHAQSSRGAPAGRALLRAPAARRELSDDEVGPRGRLGQAYRPRCAGALPLAGVERPSSRERRRPATASPNAELHSRRRNRAANRDARPRRQVRNWGRATHMCGAPKVRFALDQPNRVVGSIQRHVEIMPAAKASIIVGSPRSSPLRGEGAPSCAASAAAVEPRPLGCRSFTAAPAGRGACR